MKKIDLVVGRRYVPYKNQKMGKPMSESNDSVVWNEARAKEQNFLYYTGVYERRQHCFDHKYYSSGQVTGDFFLPEDMAPLSFEKGQIARITLDKGTEARKLDFEASALVQVLWQTKPLVDEDEAHKKYAVQEIEVIDGELVSKDFKIIVNDFEMTPLSKEELELLELKSKTVLKIKNAEKTVFPVEKEFLLEAHQAACKEWKTKLETKFPSVFEKTKQVITIGQIYVDVTDQQEYLLAQVAVSKVALIGLEDANRYCEAVYVEWIKNITEREFYRITDGRPKNFIKKS